MDVVKYPADVLREKCTDVKEFGPELEEFVQQMVGAMEREKGIGLAGPQVDRPENIFVVGLPDYDPIAFINPVIVQTSVETSSYEEGCLSLPGVYGDVVRPSMLTIQAFTPKGKIFKMDADDLMARVIQHEFDHLKGVLFFDHMSVGKREKLIKTYHKKMRA